VKIQLTLLRPLHKEDNIERRKIRTNMLATATWTTREIAQEEEEQEEEALEFRFGSSNLYNESDNEDLNVDPIQLDAHITEEEVTVDASVQQSYEDLCRSHVEKYLSSAENYIQENALSQRISEWRNKLAPVLIVQESRTSFDVHKYGHDLVNSMSSMNLKEISFEKVVGKVEPHEVCRNFAAALQLVNNGNIDFVVNGNSLKLQLLSAEFRDISSYRAPSMNINSSEENLESLKNNITKSKKRSRKQTERSNNKENMDINSIEQKA